ncbi:cell division topological specificity factor MinE [Defluviitalea phaphyphila]|uniref:cell division topological specificity factor MinE n=1 Tax=Defluviitalea phaphyphila TaxID=1473580 RepID=UPI0007303C5E|nr:cell division topological specificity factor MinE [Defluviitalea phaphyphila]
MELLNFFNKKTKSGNVAKDRLKLLLIHDRINCSSELLEMMKTDIIKVISNYMDIDETELDIQISQTKSEENNGTVPVLYANIPIKNIRKANNNELSRI